jgi:hypothetical protein
MRSAAPHRGSADTSPCAGRAHVRERVTVGVADAEALSGLVRDSPKTCGVEMLGSVRTAMERRGRLARGCFLPVDARDDYLRTIADRLTGVEVLQAVTAVVYWHRADR